MTLGDDREFASRARDPARLCRGVTRQAHDRHADLLQAARSVHGRCRRGSRGAAPRRAARLSRSIRRRKREAGALDFLDLLIKARDLVRDGPACAAFRDRFRVLLVDEFQDTDPLQAELLLCLRR